MSRAQDPPDSARSGGGRAGAESAGAESAGAESAGAESAGAESAGAERAGSEQGNRARTWALPVLLAAAAGAALPDLWDMDVFKLSSVALLAAAVLLPWLALRGGEDVRGWLASTGGRLHLLSVALALPAAIGGFGNAAVADRLLGVALATIAAVLGVRAARAAGPARALGSLSTAVGLAALLTAVLVLLQAVGIEERFSPPETDFFRRELVALMGSSTRAGALLALGLCAAFAVVTHEPIPERDTRMRLALSVLALATAALLLTRARGAWLAAAAGLLAVSAANPEATLARARLWLTRMAVGVGLALVLAGGLDLFTRGKLPEPEAGAAASIAAGDLTGGDLTTGVRVAVWRGTATMIGERPVLGWGLGQYRAEFPPFRDPAEAALPGLGGARTEVDHPHDEFLLAAAEGGVLAGLCLLLFALLTLLRGWRLARGPDGAPAARLAFGVFVAGCAVACVQNAWTSPGTALPVFAAAGVIWGLQGRRTASGAAQAPDSPRSAAWPLLRAATLAGLLLAMAGLLLLALPRLDAHLRLRSFYLRAAEEDVTPRNFRLLAEAADASPGDIDVQRLVIAFGSELLKLPAAQLAAAGEPGGVPAAEAIGEAVARARERAATLAPHAAQ